MIVRVFNRMGRPLAQLKPYQAARAWRLNQIGRAQVSIPRTSTKVDDEFLRFGNLITIESEVAQLWGGVILPPRKWDDDYVTITAYSGERLLQGRALPKNMHSKNSAPGLIFKEIIEYVHREYQPNLDIGQIKRRGRAVSKRYQFDDVWGAVTELAEMAQNDVWIEPYYDKNRWLRFKANWYEQRGKDLSGKVALIENVNMRGVTGLTESGEILNHWIYFGPGDKETIAVGEYVDRRLAGLHGRWTGVQSVADPHDHKTLKEMAQERVEETKYADQIFRANCQDKDAVGETTGLWLAFEPGDIVRLESHTVGFSPEGELGFRGKAQVISCSLNEAQGYMPIVAQEVQE